MANFLAISTARVDGVVTVKPFERAVANARLLKNQTPYATTHSSWAHGASFARANGSGGRLARDAATGSWLLAVGTWLYGAGRDDVEELLRRYLAADAPTLARELEGFFCVVIGDARTEELVVITDLMGSCHAFTRETSAGTMVSGSSLLLASVDAVSWDAIAVQELIHTGVVYEDRTCYQEVRKLPPASVTWLAEGRLRRQSRYWTIADVVPNSIGDHEAVTQVWERLRAVTGQLGRRFARIACDLTGGYDSRAVAAGFIGAGVPFTATVSGPAASPDVQVSQGLARLLGVPHHHSADLPPVSLAAVGDTLALTDGEMDLFDYARVAQVHRELMARFDLSINGSYGEVARGYWWELLFPKTGQRDAFDVARLARLRFAAAAHDSTLFVDSVRLDLVSHFAAMITRVNEALRDAPNTLQMDNTYLMLRMQRWQGRIASSTNQLWPALAPFLCRSLLETLLRTRPNLRLRSLLVRRMFARFEPRLARFPLEHGYPPMPFNLWHAWRFAPLIPYYGKRVWRKWGPRSGRGGARLGEPPRLQYWRAPEMNALLDPASMRTGALFAPDRLARFLAQSQQAAFPYDAAWRRLVSLELTGRALERIGVPPRP